MNDDYTVLDLIIAPEKLIWHLFFYQINKLRQNIIDFQINETFYFIPIRYKIKVIISFAVFLRYHRKDCFIIILKLITSK